MSYIWAATDWSIAPAELPLPGGRAGRLPDRGGPAREREPGRRGVRRDPAAMRGRRAAARPCAAAASLPGRNVSVTAADRRPSTRLPSSATIIRGLPAQRRPATRTSDEHEPSPLALGAPQPASRPLSRQHAAAVGPLPLEAARPPRGRLARRSRCRPAETAKARTRAATSAIGVHARPCAGGRDRSLAPEARPALAAGTAASVQFPANGQGRVDGRYCGSDGAGATARRRPMAARTTPGRRRARPARRRAARGGGVLGRPRGTVRAALLAVPVALGAAPHSRCRGSGST